MLCQLYIITLIPAVLTTKMEHHKEVMNDVSRGGSDYVVGGLPLVEEPGGRWGLPPMSIGIEGLDRYSLSGYEWVAQIKTFGKNTFHTAHKPGAPHIVMSETEAKEYWASNKKYQPFYAGCTGVMITQFTILSADHCFWKPRSSFLVKLI